MGKANSSESSRSRESTHWILKVLFFFFLEQFQQEELDVTYMAI